MIATKFLNVFKAISEIHISIIFKCIHVKSINSNFGAFQLIFINLYSGYTLLKHILTCKNKYLII